MKIAFFLFLIFSNFLFTLYSEEGVFIATRTSDKKANAFMFDNGEKITYIPPSDEDTFLVRIDKTEVRTPALMSKLAKEGAYQMYDILSLPSSENVILAINNSRILGTILLQIDFTKKELKRINASPEGYLFIDIFHIVKQ